MAIWRTFLLVVTCALLLGIASGCAPASSSLVEEENEPNVVRAMSRESALDYTGAIESYQRALVANPQSSVAHFRLAFLYVRQNSDPAAAIYHFQQYLKLRPNSEHANIIRQHIIGCKQELSKEFAIGPMADEVKIRLDQLVQENQQLKEANLRLADENRRLKEHLNRLQPGLIAPDTVSTPPDQNSAELNRRTNPPVRPVSSKTHTVQSGDTYYSIAKRYGIKTATLEAANPGVNPNRLNIGQTLVVPAP